MLRTIAVLKKETSKSAMVLPPPPATSTDMLHRIAEQALAQLDRDLDDWEEHYRTWSSRWQNDIREFDFANVSLAARAAHADHQAEKAAAEHAFAMGVRQVSASPSLTSLSGHAPVSRRVRNHPSVLDPRASAPRPDYVRNRNSKESFYFGLRCPADSDDEDEFEDCLLLPGSASTDSVTPPVDILGYKSDNESLASLGPSNFDSGLLMSYYDLEAAASQGTGLEAPIFGGNPETAESANNCSQTLSADSDSMVTEVGHEPGSASSASDDDELSFAEFMKFRPKSHIYRSLLV